MAVLYADDTTLYSSSKYPSNIQVSLNNDVEKLATWFNENRLYLNNEKSEYMLIASSHTRRQFKDIKITVGGIILGEKDNIKILGVNLSNNLAWDAHLNRITNNLKFNFRSFRRSCRVLKTDSRKLLYNAVIASRLNYCDMVWDCCKINNRNKLQTIQNRCARVILGSQPGTTAAPLLKELRWLNLETKRKLHKCVFVHKLLKGEGPQELINQIYNYTIVSQKTTRGSTNNNLRTVSHNTDYITKSFFYDTIKVWNKIPTCIRDIKDSHTFKERLNNHFLNL